MSKEIPAKELKGAISSINTILGTDDTPAKIKTVGIKKVAVIETFTETVNSFIEDDKSSDLPDDVIDFYNKFIVGEDSEDDEVSEQSESEEKASKKKKSEKKTSKKKTSKKKSEKKTSESKITKKSVCIELLERKGGASLKEMGEEITKRGIDDDTDKNTRTAGLWMRKIGFPTMKLDDGNYVKCTEKQKEKSVEKNAKAKEAKKEAKAKAKDKAEKKPAKKTEKKASDAKKSAKKTAKKTAKKSVKKKKTSKKK